MSTATYRQAPVVGAPYLPQVNLLPPEVRAARGLTATKRMLGLGLVGVLLLAGVGYAAALGSSASASSDLAAAQSERARLKAEEAKFSAVPPVVNGLSRAQEARASGMSTEITWKSYLDAISAVLPPHTSIATLTVVEATPAVAAPPPAEPRSNHGVATITFTSHSRTLPDASAWLIALNTIPNFSDATFSAAAIGQDAGPVSYEVTSSVQVAVGAYASRFADTTKGN